MGTISKWHCTLYRRLKSLIINRISDRPLPSGQAAEIIACNFLRKKGLLLLTRNYHCPFGEIDLIMQEGSCLVFVEVRYRRNHQYGHPLETVTRNKQRKISWAAEAYLSRQTKKQQCLPCRFDVVTLSGSITAPTLHWLPNAFDRISPLC